VDASVHVMTLKRLSKKGSVRCRPLTSQLGCHRLAYRLQASSVCELSAASYYLRQIPTVVSLHDPTLQSDLAAIRSDYDSQHQTLYDHDAPIASHDTLDAGEEEVIMQRLRTSRDRCVENVQAEAARQYVHTDIETARRWEEEREKSMTEAQLHSNEEMKTGDASTAVVATAPSLPVVRFSRDADECAFWSTVKDLWPSMLSGATYAGLQQMRADANLMEQTPLAATVDELHSTPDVRSRCFPARTLLNAFQLDVAIQDGQYAANLLGVVRTTHNELHVDTARTLVGSG
jgi:hypothetical protein